MVGEKMLRGNMRGIGVDHRNSVVSKALHSIMRLLATSAIKVGIETYLIILQSL